MKYIFFIMLLPLSVGLYAQADMEILQDAQALAEQKKYVQALETLTNGLTEYPQHHDLLCYKARLFLWDGQFDQAGQVLDEVLELFPQDEEALDIKLTGLMWQEDWKKLLFHAEEALNVYPEKANFQLFKVKALVGLGYYNYAKYLLEDDDSEQALKDRLFLMDHQYVRVNGDHSRFSSDFDPWTLLSATYGQTGKHSWDVSATHGQLFDQSGMRFNTTAYPMISPKLSAFLEAGYSPSTIFPNMELGAELTRQIWKFELAGGMKYLKFSDAGNVFIYKGVVAGYFGKNYASYRMYYAQVLNTPSFTHLVTLRHYFHYRFHYIQLQGSLGSTPVQVNTLQEAQRLDAQGVLLSYKHLLKSNKWLFDIGVGYQNEKYLEGQTRERGNLQLGVTRLWD